MLALLAALILSPSRVLPEPFLPNRLEPIVPVGLLAHLPRASVTRGGNWRPGGYVRLNYFYRFPPGQGPTHEDFKGQDGFQETAGFNGSVRCSRERNGVRQVVVVSDLARGVYWKWAKLSGPARVVTLTEFPVDKPPRWHYLPQLIQTPAPPGFPPPYKFLTGFKLDGIYSDPIIPRNFRTEFTVIVRLSSHRPVEEVWDEAEAELTSGDWRSQQSRFAITFNSRNSRYGLVRAEVFRPTLPNSRYSSEIVLTYLFEDRENGPRIE